MLHCSPLFGIRVIRAFFDFGRIALRKASDFDTFSTLEGSLAPVSQLFRVWKDMRFQTRKKAHGFQGHPSKLEKMSKGVVGFERILPRSKKCRQVLRDRGEPFGPKGSPADRSPSLSEPLFLPPGRASSFTAMSENGQFYSSCLLDCAYAMPSLVRAIRTKGKTNIRKHKIATTRSLWNQFSILNLILLIK